MSEEFTWGSKKAIGPISVVPEGETSPWPKEELADVTELTAPGTEYNLSVDSDEISSRMEAFYSGEVEDIEGVDAKGDLVFSFPKEVTDKLRSRFCFITGKAGTGKSTLLRLEDEKDFTYIEKGSTTGIAAINCGGRTVHSILKYYNTESLERSYDFGNIHNQLRLVRTRKRVLGIDEVSMLDAKQLDIIMNAIDDISQDDIDDDRLWCNLPKNLRENRVLGLHLIGDMAQLPPVKAEYAFKAKCWDECFAPNVIKLEKIWRQDNDDFIAAINAIRAGNGREAVKLLKSAGVRFERNLESHFDGTTLIPNNADVDMYNNKKLAELSNPMIRIQPIRRGSQAKEWDRNSKGEWGIPFEQRFKLDAYVMILRNDSKNFSYVNGDCGKIVKYHSDSKSFDIELVRTGDVVNIKMIKDFNYQDKQPSEGQFNSMFAPYEDKLTGQWVTGSIEWMPLRLAWASTIHKSQGLSLDRVQIDSRPQFYGYPSMCYVAVSRARTPEGLIIVGNESEFVHKVNTSREVLKWI